MLWIKNWIYAVDNQKKKQNTVTKDELCGEKKETIRNWNVYIAINCGIFKIYAFCLKKKRKKQQNLPWICMWISQSDCAKHLWRKMVDRIQSGIRENDICAQR